MRLKRITQGRLTAIVNHANGAYSVQLWEDRTEIHREVYNSQETAERRARDWCYPHQEDSQPEEMADQVVDSGEITAYANTVFGQTKY